MINKKAIELSMNFIVILILSIVIFGFGIVFISKLSSQANELQELTISDLDERIGELVCEGSDRVCIGIDRKIIKRKEFKVFGIKILNIIDSQSFDTTIEPSSPIGYKKDKTPIESGPFLTINPNQRSDYIEKNEEKNIGIGIQVPPNAVSGTYIFNVKIQQTTQAGKQYVPIQKLYVDVP